MANIAETNDVVRLAVDSYRGTVEKYSVRQSQDTLRQALIEANNGKTYLDYRDIRDGKCNGLFALVETILGVTVVDGLQGDEYFNTLVDFRNVAEGDSPIFTVEDSNLFVVAEVADGTQGIRRQRLGGVTETTIPTSMKMVRIYEELNRVLANRVDFNAMINKVAESFNQKLLNDIYTLWIGATADQMGGDKFFPTAGTYDPDALLDVIAHVEAAAGGKPATILCTKKGSRKLKEELEGDATYSKLQREEIHNFGYVGKFYGTPVVVTPQRHKVGTTEFILDDNVITVVASTDKPIKIVYEGDPIVLMGNPMDNADFTQEYLYGVKYGAGILLAGGNSGIGRYQITP